METATKVCSVGVSIDGELVGIKESNDTNYSHGEKLNLFIEELLKKSNISMKEIAAISVASGPGSYTGLRIGAATAKALCYSLDIPLIAVDALTSLAAQAKEKYSSKNLCALIDARRMEAYNLITDANLSPLKEISADVLDEASYAEFEPFVFFGDGAAKLSELWQGRNCIFDAEIYSSAKGQVQIAFDKFQKNAFVDVAYWEPFYLKDFIAGKKGS